jgi:hypothetical protein|tara:strand:- start:233 stop:460 length:228 start_codon:yes stop_codon:yes gene_type:complete
MCVLIFSTYLNAAESCYESCELMHLIGGFPAFLLIAFAVQFFHPRKIKEMISNPRGRARMKKEPGGRLPVLVLII